VIGHNQWRVIGETMRERSPKQHLDTEAMNGRHRDRLRWDHIVRAIVGDFLVPRAEPVLMMRPRSERATGNGRGINKPDPAAPWTSPAPGRAW